MSNSIFFKTLLFQTFATTEIPVFFPNRSTLCPNGRILIKSIDNRRNSAYDSIIVKRLFNRYIEKFNYAKGVFVMKKTYKIEVDCANCANLMENAARKTSGVQTATVNFMTQKMIVEFAEGNEPTNVMQDVVKACKKVEPDCEIFL